MIEVKNPGNWLLAVGLLLFSGAAYAAYNELPPGVITLTNLGTNVFTYLANAADSATGFVSGNALGANVQAALAAPLNATAGLQSGLSINPTVAAAVQNAVNNASGLIQLDSSGGIPILPQDGVINGVVAQAGDIGEVIASDVPVGTPVSVITATPKTLTSVSLTPGDWNCSGSIATAPATTTTTSSVIGGVSTAANTLPTGIEFRHQLTLAIAANTPYGAPVPSVVENLSSTTTVFLVGQASFATSTMTMYGQISCRRMR